MLVHKACSARLKVGDGGSSAFLGARRRAAQPPATSLSSRIERYSHTPADRSGVRVVGEG